ncbi:Bax inhibitor-1/YccA family protein [Curvibacter gracilis]|uniref:Bax inhibitor-1/YccA family protein n=1 Tax=Curvibacter gracilis TaxID=230310 RepID=UPI0004B9E702|nr:Bax inhibitor-1/YccA family protein [Curvibacter gracilis]
MTPSHPDPSTSGQGRPIATWPVSEARPALAPAAQRVLRNTYALLAMTLLLSAAVAVLSLALQLPGPGPLLGLAISLGLLWAVHRLQHSAWALPAVFALTGFMGYSLGPLLTRSLALPGGTEAVALALASTGATFLALSSYVLLTRRDFGFLGGFLTAGLLIALLAGVAALLLQIPALALTVSVGVALLSAALILYETSRIVHGGETNYVLATVGLYVSLFNLFTSLLSLFGLGGSDD